MQEFKTELRENNQAFVLENFEDELFEALKQFQEDRISKRRLNEVLKFYKHVLRGDDYQKIFATAKKINKNNIQGAQLKALFAKAWQDLPPEAFPEQNTEEQEDDEFLLSTDASLKQMLYYSGKKLYKIANSAVRNPGKALTTVLAAQVAAVAALDPMLAANRRNESNNDNALTASLLQKQVAAKSETPINNSLVRFENQLATRSMRKRALNTEFLVNTNTTNDQEFPATATLIDGNFVVVWQSDGQDGSSYGIYAQIFTEIGAKMGSEFLVNTYTPSYQSSPAVASLTNGNFAVVWMSDSQDGSGYGIYAQIFTAAGAKVGSEFLVNTYTTNSQSSSAIASLTNGNFAVVWQSNGRDGSGDGVYAQVFTAAGAKVGSEFQVNTYTASNQNFPAIASLTNGNFAVVWQSNGQEGLDYGIYAQIFTVAGAKVGSEFLVNTYTTNDQKYPAIASLTNGNFVVVWSSDGQDGSSDGVYAQIFTAAGAKVGSEFLVNTYITYAQFAPVIASLTNGNFAVVWISGGQDGSSDGVYAQIFTAAGVKVGDEFQVNTYIIGIQSYPFVGSLIDNNLVVTWMSVAQDGSGYGVYAKIIDTSLSATNTNQAISYTEDTNYNLADINITPPMFISNVTATLTLSNLSAGSLTTATSGSVVATYNTGVWQASGAVSDVNTLLASVQFVLALNFNSGFNIAVNITDNFNTPLIDTISATGTAVNDAPTVQNILQNKAFSLNQTFSFIAPENNTFFDPDVNDTLIYEATQTSGAALPAWISFNATENIFTGRADEAGVSYFRITATDTLNATVSADFTITTLNPLVPSPVISPTGQIVSPPGLTPNSISPTGQTVSPPALTPNSVSPTGQTISPSALIPSPISTTALSPPTSNVIPSLSQYPSTSSAQPINNSTNTSDLGLILGLLFGILGCASLSVAGVLLAWRFKLLKKLLQLQQERRNAQEENKATSHQELGVVPDNSQSSQALRNQQSGESNYANFPPIENAPSNNQNNALQNSGPLRTQSQISDYANAPTKIELAKAKQNASSNNQTNRLQDGGSVRISSQVSRSMQAEIKPTSSRAISNSNPLVKNESSTTLVTYANSPPVNKPNDRASYDALRSSGLLASSAAKRGTNDSVNVTRINSNAAIQKPEESEVQSVQFG